MNLPKQNSHRIICVDMKSFYATCEAILRGLDPLTAKIAVVGDVNRNGSVVLASSPTMKKKHNIKTGNRLFEVKKINDPEIIIAQAQMGFYLETSHKIREIFLEFVPPDALHIYSVDESWLTLDGTEKLWGNSWETSQKIIDRVKEVTGCIATIGIGENKFQAKICLDIFGKEHSIFECTSDNFAELFHSHTIKEMWGIGNAIEKRMNALNIFTIGDLASYSTEKLKEEFGTNGIKLQEFAIGYDPSPVFYNAQNPQVAAFGFGNSDSLHDDAKSIGRGVTLLKDYRNREEILSVIKELTEEICFLLRQRNVAGRTIQLSVGYSNTTNKKGFSRQYSFKNQFFNDSEDFKEVLISLFNEHDDNKSPVRTLRVSISKLKDFEENEDLLDDRKKVLRTLDRLNERFGSGKVRKASSFTESSISNSRTKKISGHFK